MASDEYEISDPMTIGGATGQYNVPSPYHTECEWSIISAIALGTLATTANFVICSKTRQPALQANGSDSFGAAASGVDSNNALPAYVGALTATAPMITYGGDNYMPLPSPALVNATITVPATSEVLITLQFRRKLDREIPEKPRSKPHTHSHVAPRREHRSMMLRFSDRYPEEGIPYSHEGIPVSQDTAVFKRGVSPLQATDTKHRRLKNGR
jgi:hypothetical protein